MEPSGHFRAALDMEKKQTSLKKAGSNKHLSKHYNVDDSAMHHVEDV